MKHLIFDCGGVLVYPRMGDWSLPVGIAPILGPRARDIHTARYLTAHREAVGWLDESRLVPDTEEERRLRREYIRAIDLRMDWHMTEDEINRLTDDFTDNWQRYGLFDDVKTWLPRWKALLRAFGISELFDGIVISTQVGAIKPDPKMYAAIVAALNTTPEECLFVDDRACNLEGAARAGMKAVQMARSEFLPDVLWDGPVVRSFEKLNALIEGGL